MGHESNALIQGEEFVQHNRTSNIHNCYDADGVIVLLFSLLPYELTRPFLF